MKVPFNFGLQRLRVWGHKVLWVGVPDMGRRDYSYRLHDAFRIMAGVSGVAINARVAIVDI